MNSKVRIEIDAGLRELWMPFGRSAYVIRFSHNARTGETIIARIWHARAARPEA